MLQAEFSAFLLARKCLEFPAISTRVRGRCLSWNLIRDRLLFRCEWMIAVRHKIGVGSVLVLWLGAIAAGFAAWERYDATPGEASQPAPVASRPAGRWVLVMFAHPRCECTEASFTELRELMSRSPNDIEVRVLFVRPKGAAEGWERTPLWTTAAGIPGVKVECDAGGVEARLAGATASGHAVLRAPDGRVVFRGGITKARGRAGDSPGRRAILSLLRGESTSEQETPTFGCPLFSPRECCNTEGR
jgi:hypothetical protein